MHNWGGGDFISTPLLLAGPLFGFAMLVLLWSFVWKGLALWHAGRRGDAWWFVILLIINTAGILEIIYLFAVAKLKVGELFSKHTHHNH